MQNVILNADDYGYDVEVSRGILEAMEHGFVASTTFMVNSPASVAAAATAPARGVGLHLNLVRFHSLCDSKFEFSDATASSLPSAFVLKEASAQIAMFSDLLHRAPTHLDVHKHAHRWPNILRGVIEVARAHALAVRSIDAAMCAELKAHGIVTNDAFVGDTGREPFWTHEELSRQIKLLCHDGIVEWMCHPGYEPTAFQSSYGRQREVELATLTSERAFRLVQEAGIRFISWEDMNSRGSTVEAHATRNEA